jgi:hypothetical protein
MALLATFLLSLASCQDEATSTDHPGEHPAPETGGPQAETGTPSPETGESGDTGTSPALSWVYAEVGEDARACGRVSDGTVRCWGSVGWEQVAPPPEVVFQQLSVGDKAACGVLESGELACWCLGAHDEDTIYELCQQVPKGTFVRVETGEYDACAQQEDGTLVCFGASDLEPPSQPLVDFAMRSGACGLREDGEIVCWKRPAFMEGVELPAGPFTELALGAQQVCGLDTAGDMRCVGGLQTQLPTPEVFPGPFTTIEADYVTFCGLLADGHPSCWWSIDDPDVPLMTPPDLPFAQLGVESRGGCGVLLDGSATCWGDGASELEVPEL